MNTFPWFDDSLALRLVQALLHFLWQGCAVALVAAVAGRALRRASAHVRYSFHVAAMLVMMVCLPVTFALLEVPRAVGPELQTLTTAPVPNNLARADLSSKMIGASAGVPSAKSAAEPSGHRYGAEWLAVGGIQLSSWLTPFAPTVMAAYFLGVALMALRLTLALRGGRRLRQSAIPVDDKRLLAMLDQQIRRMGMKVAPAVAYCERISIPIVVGIVKPVILLPAALATGLSPDQLQALLAHELAHIRRFDLLVNLFQRLAEAVLFFHPAVWFVSRRVSMEREVAADDMVLAAGWHRVHYADALVRMAELSSALRNTRIVEQGAALAAWGAHESEFKHRVLRLLTGDDRPLVRLTRAGWASFLAVLILVALTPLLVQAWAPLPDEPRPGPQAIAPKPDKGKAPVKSPAPPASSDPRIIIAEHVLLWDNQIVTWDQVVERLRVKRKSGPVHATFYSTNGLSKSKDGWQDYHDRIMKLYPELFQPAGVTFASASPRGSALFDAIRTADDLRPDPKRARSGQVVTPSGEPARDAQVIVLPTKVVPYAALDIALAGTQMRDSFDEEWSPTDDKGQFVVHPKDDAYLLVILHPSGFATQPGNVKTELLKLQPWATITFRATGEVADQHASITIRRPGAKSEEPGFRIYEIQTKGKPIEVKVPAGEILLSRSLEMGEGVAISLPVETFALRAGEARILELKPPTDADRKRAKEVYEELHGPRDKAR